MKNNTENKELAQIYNLLIIDESGSMHSLKTSTMSGVNEVLDTIRQAQTDFAESQEHFVTIVTFNTARDANIRITTDAAPINSVPAFTNYNPSGSTPLLDAVGISLTRLERQLSGNDMATAVVTIVTDGLENASLEYSSAQVRELIERLTTQGWTFSYMGACHDVKQVARRLSIGNVMEFAHDDRGTSSSWMRERGSKRSHYQRIHREIDQLRSSSCAERAARWVSYSDDYYSDRVTPHMVTRLAANEVFVFGSNIHGNHNGGAAGQALQHFGAVMGQAEGRQGNAYAIPTTDGIQPVPLFHLRESVERFLYYAAANPDTRFLVTRIGCGNAGLTVAQVAPLFEQAAALNNVSLPVDFWDYLGLTF